MKLMKTKALQHFRHLSSTQHSMAYWTLIQVKTVSLSELITWMQVKALHKQQTSHIQSSSQTNLGYGFHFQQRNPIPLLIESFAHDSGCTLVCAKYGYPKGSLNTNGTTVNAELASVVKLVGQLNNNW
jgi:hypothetical protein